MTAQPSPLDLSGRAYARRTPTLRPYSPARHREWTRALIAGLLLLLLGITVGGILFAVYTGRLEGTSLTQAVFPAMVGLVGTAIGFYFGGESRSNTPS